MTVTIVYGKTTDGYGHNYDASYTTARNGPADGISQGTYAYIGQNKIGASPYAAFEAFVGWDYVMPPDTEIVTAAIIRVKVDNVLNKSVAQQMELRGYGWSTGGLLTTDWRTPAQLAALRLDGSVATIEGAEGKYVHGSSDEFLTEMSTHASMEEVVITDRMRAGTTPTSDEGVAIRMSEESGTTYDPALVYTSCPRSTLFGVMGAQVQLSDGSHAYLESNGAVSPTITLKRRTTAGVVSTIATLSIGTTSTSFFTPKGAQAFALVADPSDNLFVISRVGNAENSIAAQAFTFASGYTYTAGTIRSAAMPTISTAINQVAATYHSTLGGTITAFVGHTAGPGHPTLTTGVMQATLSVSYLLTGSGSLIRGSGSSSNVVMPYVSVTGVHNTYPNEVGSGMDVATPLDGNPEWGFFYSFQHGQLPGDNDPLAAGRYILNAATASSFTHYSWEEGLGYGRKDAGGKVRVVPISSTTACFVSADDDPGWGLTVFVQQHTGTDTGSVTLAGLESGGESIPSMPDGPDIGQSCAWDAVYNSVENRLWLYYEDMANAGRVMRSSFNLTTMQYDQNEVEVYSAASGTASVQAIRVQRNAPVTQSTLVTIAILDGTTRSTVLQTDTFNLAPTAPTLTPKANFDATAASTFAWTFNDPNNDAQAAYQLEISRADNGTISLDTGKVSSATPSRVVTGGTLTNGVSYRWRVRAYDPLDEVSPWSDYGTFSTSAGGTVTITNPSTDNALNVVTDEYPIVWSVAGTTQAAYRVWLYRGVDLVSDTGWLASSALTHLITGMTSGVEHTVQVRVRNASNVESGTGTRLITPSYATPEVPLISVTAADDDGYVLVSVDNPAPGAPAIGADEWDFEVATDVDDWTVVGGSKAHSTAQAHRGTGSMLLTANGTDPQCYARNYTGDALVPVVPGTRYTCRAWVYSSVARNVTAAIDWNASGGYISTSAVDTLVAANTWTQITASGTAPDTAVTATYGATMPSNPAAGTLLYIDELVLTGASDRPEVTENEILRRRLGDTGEWEVVGTCAPDGTFRDYQAAIGVTYEYKVRGQA